MTTATIRLSYTKQINALVELLTPYPFEIDLVCGHFTIDAKSLLGIYSLNLSQALQVVLYSDDCEELLEKLKAFR